MSAPFDAALAGETSRAHDGERSAIARARAGDRSAFGELHHRYVKMVHAIVLAHAPARDAADLTQEVFTRALINITNLRADESAGPWFAGIARNVARDCLRSRKFTSELPQALEAPPAPRAALDDAREILDVIHTLPDTYRETLLMRLLEGMNGPEISDRTGMTPGSVRVHLHRGMKLLNDALGRRGLLP